MIAKADLDKFSAQTAEQLFGHILPFWCGPALDNEKGGWMAWLSNDLKPDRSQPKGLIVNTRILWVFSAAYRTQPKPIYRDMARRAFDYVLNNFWDKQHGGAFWRLHDDGRVMDDSKKIYGQAFCIYALSEFYRAIGDAGSLAPAQEVFELIERHAHDPKFGGYIEVCRRDWSESGPEARLSDKDMNEKKSMNNHLHVLEAFTTLHRVWPSPRVVERLRELIGLFLDRILDPRTLHLHHFFDEQWNVRSHSYTFGHDIEATWLLCEAAEELGDEELLKRVRDVAAKMAAVTLEQGLAAQGGLCYEGKDEKIIDPGRESWPQAEAAIGFLNAYQITRDEKFYAAARKIWNFIEENIVDHVNGEWFWRILPDGKVDQKLPKVSEWKGPYHGSRACMEIMQRLKQIAV